MVKMRSKLVPAVVIALFLGAFAVIHADAQFFFSARDPGVRGGAPGAGAPIAGLTAREIEFFQTGQEDFEEVEVVADGLGPRMNLDSCAAATPIRRSAVPARS